jgi:hypothetical protein
MTYIHNGVSYYVGFEVLPAVFIKSIIFWSITPCSPLKVNRHFGGTYRLHLQGRRIRQARYQRESRCQAEFYFKAGFLLVLFLDPEDGGDMFIRNICWLSTDYTAIYSRRQYSSNLILIDTLLFNNALLLYLLPGVEGGYCSEFLIEKHVERSRRELFKVRSSNLIRWIKDSLRQNGQLLVTNLGPPER